MSPSQLLQAALVADFLPRYRGMLGVLLHRARRFAATRSGWRRNATIGTEDAGRSLRHVRRILLHRAAGRLYRLCDRWGGVGVFPPIDPDAPELPLLHAVVELAAARRDGDAARRRQWRRALERAAVALGTEVRR